jgi:hypothetical protein
MVVRVDYLELDGYETRSDVTVEFLCGDMSGFAVVRSADGHNKSIVKTSRILFMENVDFLHEERK